MEKWQGLLNSETITMFKEVELTNNTTGESRLIDTGNKSAEQYFNSVSGELCEEHEIVYADFSLKLFSKFQEIMENKEVCNSKTQWKSVSEEIALNIP